MQSPYGKLKARHRLINPGFLGNLAGADPYRSLIYSSRITSSTEISIDLEASVKKLTKGLKSEIKMLQLYKLFLDKTAGPRIASFSCGTYSQVPNNYQAKREKHQTKTGQ